MAQNLLVNGIVYNGVIAIEMDNESGEKVQYTEGGNGDTVTEDLSAVLAEQEQLIATLQETLRNKTAGEGGEADTRFAELVQGTLAEVYDESITTIKQYGFAYTDELKSVNLPNATTINPSAFRECSNLETVNLPSVTGTLGSYTFYDCSKLKTVNVPLASNSSTGIFQNCVELEKIDFGTNMTTVGANAFSGCSKLTTLIIRGGRSNGTAPPSMSNANAFANTPIAAGTGYVYVSKSLIDKYKTATNWSTYAAQIRAIEDYPEICGG